MQKNNKKSKTPEPDNPVPVRMGEELKEQYRSEAFKLDRSMQWVMLQALRSYAKSFNKS